MKLKILNIIKHIANLIFETKTKFLDLRFCRYIIWERNNFNSMLHKAFIFNFFLFFVCIPYRLRYCKEYIKGMRDLYNQPMSYEEMNCYYVLTDIPMRAPLETKEAWEKRMLSLTDPAHISFFNEERWKGKWKYRDKYIWYSEDFRGDYDKADKLEGDHREVYVYKSQHQFALICGVLMCYGAYLYIFRHTCWNSTWGYIPHYFYPYQIDLLFYYYNLFCKIPMTDLFFDPVSRKEYKCMDWAYIMVIASVGYGLVALGNACYYTWEFRQLMKNKKTVFILWGIRDHMAYFRHCVWEPWRQEMEDYKWGMEIHDRIRAIRYVVEEHFFPHPAFRAVSPISCVFLAVRALPGYIYVIPNAWYYLLESSEQLIKYTSVPEYGYNSPYNKIGLYSNDILEWLGYPPIYHMHPRWCEEILTFRNQPSWGPLIVSDFDGDNIGGLYYFGFEFMISLTLISISYALIFEVFKFTFCGILGFITFYTMNEWLLFIWCVHKYGRIGHFYYRWRPYDQRYREFKDEAVENFDFYLEFSKNELCDVWKEHIMIMLYKRHGNFDDISPLNWIIYYFKIEWEYDHAKDYMFVGFFIRYWYNAVKSWRFVLVSCIWPWFFFYSLYINPMIFHFYHLVPEAIIHLSISIINNICPLLWVDIWLPGMKDDKGIEMYGPIGHIFEVNDCLHGWAFILLVLGLFDVFNVPIEEYREFKYNWNTLKDNVERVFPKKVKVLERKHKVWRNEVEIDIQNRKQKFNNYFFDLMSKVIKTGKNWNYIIFNRLIAFKFIFYMKVSDKNFIYVRNDYKNMKNYELTKELTFYILKYFKLNISFSITTFDEMLTKEMYIENLKQQISDNVATLRKITHIPSIIRDYIFLNLFTNGILIPLYKIFHYILFKLPITIIILTESIMNKKNKKEFIIFYLDKLYCGEKEAVENLKKRKKRKIKN